MSETKSIESETPAAVAGAARGSEVPTPRTDEEARLCRVKSSSFGDMVGADFAQALERELIAANTELDAIRAVFQHGADEENWKPGTTLAEAVAKLKASAGLPNVELSDRRENNP
jgi:hypothetical protein